MSLTLATEFGDSFRVPQSLVLDRDGSPRPADRPFATANGGRQRPGTRPWCNFVRPPPARIRKPVRAPETCGTMVAGPRFLAGSAFWRVSYLASCGLGYLTAGAAVDPR
jgi:hypothetical protein